MAVKSTVGEIWPYGPMSTYKAEEKRRQQQFEQSQKLLPMREEREKALYESRLAAEKARQASWESKTGQKQVKQIALPDLYKTLEALNAQKTVTTDPAQIEKLDKLIGMVNFHLKEQLSKGIDESSEPYTPLQTGVLPGRALPEKEGNIWTRAPMTTSGFGTNNESALSGLSRNIPPQVSAKSIVPSSGGALGGLQTMPWSTGTVSVPKIMPMTRPSLTPTPMAGTTGLREISTDEEYDALPSGTEFIDAQTGIKYRKP